jgi:hypothetical protein
MTTPTAPATYRCPECGYSALSSGGRTCPACGYCGDWIQPGRTVTYEAEAATLEAAADAAYGECVRLALAAAHASAASLAADLAYEAFTASPVRK